MRIFVAVLLFVTLGRAQFDYTCDDGTDPESNGCCGASLCPSSCSSFSIESEEGEMRCECRACGESDAESEGESSQPTSSQPSQPSRPQRPQGPRPFIAYNCEKVMGPFNCMYATDSAGNKCMWDQGDKKCNNPEIKTPPFFGMGMGGMMPGMGGMMPGMGMGGMGMGGMGRGNGGGWNPYMPSSFGYFGQSMPFMPPGFELDTPDHHNPWMQLQKPAPRRVAKVQPKSVLSTESKTEHKYGKHIKYALIAFVTCFIVGILGGLVYKATTAPTVGNPDLSYTLSTV